MYPAQAWRDAIRANSSSSHVADTLPPLQDWVDLFKSKAWFSEFHFRGRASFELPFVPRCLVWSPVVEIVIPSDPTAKVGFYERGIRKYQTMIRKGKPLPPVSLVWCGRETGYFGLQDGNHRYSALAREGGGRMPAIFAFPKWLLDEMSGTQQAAA